MRVGEAKFILVSLLVAAVVLASGCGPGGGGGGALTIEELPYPSTPFGGITADASGTVWTAGFNGNLYTLNAAHTWDLEGTGSGFLAQAAGGDPVTTMTTGAKAVQAALLKGGALVSLPQLSVADAWGDPVVVGVSAVDTVFATADFGTSTPSSRTTRLYECLAGCTAWTQRPGTLTSGGERLFMRDGRVLVLDPEGLSEFTFVDPTATRALLAANPAPNDVSRGLVFIHAEDTDDVYVLQSGSFDVLRYVKGGTAWEVFATPGRPPEGGMLTQAPYRSRDGNVWLFMRTDNTSAAKGILLVLRKGATAWSVVTNELPRNFTGTPLANGDLVLGDGTNFVNWAALLHNP